MALSTCFICRIKTHTHTQTRSTFVASVLIASKKRRCQRVVRLVLRTSLGWFSGGNCFSYMLQSKLNMGQRQEGMQSLEHSVMN